MNLSFLSHTQNNFNIGSDRSNRTIYSSFILAIQNEDSEIISKYYGYLYKTLKRSIESEDKDTFRDYSMFAVWLANNSDFAGSEFGKGVISHLVLQMTEMHNFHLKKQMEVRPQSAILKVINYYIHYFFSDILKSLILNNRKELFQDVMEKYERTYRKEQGAYTSSLYRFRMNGNHLNLYTEINDTYPNYTLSRFLKIGLYSWLVYGVYSGEIDKNSIKEFQYFSKTLVLGFSSDIQDCFNDFFFLSNNQSLFNWDWWEYKKRIEGKVFTGVSMSEILSVGLFVYNIQKMRINANSLFGKTLLYHKQYEYNISKYESYANAITISSEVNWSELIGYNGTEEELQTVKSNFIQGIQNIAGEYDKIKKKEIAELKISQKRIDTYINAVGERWFDRDVVYKLFIDNNAYEVIQDDKVKLQWIALNYYLDGSKMMFVEDENHYDFIYGMDDFGASISLSSEEFLFGFYLENFKVNEIENTSIISIIDSSISRLEDMAFQPNVIFISYKFNIDNSLYNSESFVAEHNTPKYYGMIGYYKDIPIIQTYNKTFKEGVLVSDLNNSIKLKVKEDESWYKKYLKVDLTELTKEEIEEKFKERPKKWMLDKFENDLTEEEAKKRIANGVNTKIILTMDFELINKEASIYSVLQKN